MSLIEKLRKARQLHVTAGDRSWTISRPTPMEAMDWLQSAGNPLSEADMLAFYEQRFSLNNPLWREIALTGCERFVVDWPGMKEIDLVPGGDPVPAAFDTELFLLWAQDHPDVITNLGYLIFNAWLGYLNQQGADEKKPSPGSNPEPSTNNQTD